MTAALTLYRPVGLKELALIVESRYRAFPPRGDSASSTVRATARFAMVRVVTPGQANNGGMVECASRGAWERMIVREVQTAAERNGSE